MRTAVSLVATGVAVFVGTETLLGDAVAVADTIWVDVGVLATWVGVMAQPAMSITQKVWASRFDMRAIISTLDAVRLRWPARRQPLTLHGDKSGRYRARPS